jgi:hypothetical protein
VLSSSPTLQRDRAHPVLRSIFRSIAQLTGRSRVMKEQRATEEESIRRRQDEELALRRAVERAADARERVDALTALRQLRAEVRLWRQQK